MRQPDNAQVLDAGRQSSTQLFDQKAFSWTLAMEDLETVLPGGVQVTTLEPIRDEKTARITLKLRVVGPRDKDVELVQNLEHSRHFLRPAIVGESSENSGGPGQRSSRSAPPTRSTSTCWRSTIPPPSARKPTVEKSEPPRNSTEESPAAAGARPRKASPSRRRRTWPAPSAVLRAYPGRRRARPGRASHSPQAVPRCSRLAAMPQAQPQRQARRP